MRNLILFFTIILASCSGTQKAASPSFSDRAQVASESFSENENPPPTERQMIYDAYLRLQVKSAEGIGKKVGEVGKNMGGYLLRTSLESVTIRVPAERLDEALSAIGEMGEVTNQNVNGQDVTERYADLSLRLENAEKTRRRYLDLLEKAQTVAEILPIEKELEHLQLNIENLKGQINRLDELVSFSTITVSIEEKVKPGPIGWVFVGLWKGVSWLFVR